MLVAACEAKKRSNSLGDDPLALVAGAIGLLVGLLCCGGALKVWGPRMCSSKNAVYADPTSPKGAATQMTKTQFQAKIGNRGFDKVDANNSGNISKGEWAEMFETLDTNGNGVIEREEWEAVFGKGTFDSWDQNRDGEVNYQEWCRIYTSNRAAVKEKASKAAGRARMVASL